MPPNKEQREQLGKESAVEHADDALDMREDVRECRYEWHSLNSRTPLTELYAGGNLGVHVHIGIRVPLDQDKVGYGCAVVEAPRARTTGSSSRASLRRLL